jgi:hypothetical protein
VHHSSFREAKHHLPHAATSATRAFAAAGAAKLRFVGELEKNGISKYVDIPLGQ